jgi:hypothetical protein
MQATLLHAAQTLYSIDTQRLSDAQDEAAAFPWFAAVLCVALLVALIMAQRYLRKRTNRVINVGLIVATAAVVVAILWSATGLVLESVHVAHGRSSGSAPANVLAQARTEALQARTDETLNLVARGGTDYEHPYDAAFQQVGGKDGTGGLLGQAQGMSADDTMSGQVGSAITAAKSWSSLHKQAASANTSGDYDTAVAITLGNGGAGRPNEAAAFDKVDTALNQAITQARSNFADQTNSAGGWLTALPIGVLVLLLLAAAGAAVGIWQRLREYR